MATPLNQCWSQMSSDILDLILGKLLLPDCFTFAKICKSWRCIFLERRRLCRPPPCLMHNRESGSPWFLGLHESKLTRLPYFESKIHDSVQIVGYLQDWLVLASNEQNCNVHLFNLNSCEQIHLPSISEGITQGTFLELKHVVLSSSPTTTNCVLVAKGDLITTTSHGMFPSGSLISQEPVWCRPGDREWTVFTAPNFLRCCQMMFFEEQLYVVVHYTEIHVYSFEPNQKLINVISTTSIAISLKLDPNRFKSTLVESTGELFMVVCGYESDDVPHPGIVVFKLDKELCIIRERVQSLGDYVFLLGYYSTKSICTTKMMGSSFQRNCVYRIEWRLSKGAYRFCYLVMEKYCLADGSREEVLLPRNEHDKPLLNNEWIAPEAW